MHEEPIYKNGISRAGKALGNIQQPQKGRKSLREQKAAPEALRTGGDGPGKQGSIPGCHSGRECRESLGWRLRGDAGSPIPVLSSALLVLTGLAEERDLPREYPRGENIHPLLLVPQGVPWHSCFLLDQIHIPGNA